MIKVEKVNEQSKDRLAQAYEEETKPTYNEKSNNRCVPTQNDPIDETNVNGNTYKVNKSSIKIEIDETDDFVCAPVIVCPGPDCPPSSSSDKCTLHCTNASTSACTTTLSSESVKPNKWKRYRDRKKRGLPKSAPKTPAERQKESRLRKKLEKAASTKNNVSKQPKTNAERCKKYRLSKKLEKAVSTENNVSRKPKTNAERCKERRQRQKLDELSLRRPLDVNENNDVPNKRLKMNYALDDNEFDERLSSIQIEIDETDDYYYEPIVEIKENEQPIEQLTFEIKTEPTTSMEKSYSSIVTAQQDPQTTFVGNTHKGTIKIEKDEAGDFDKQATKIKEENAVLLKEQFTISLEEKTTPTCSNKL
ncbi:uncharacterized protein LOC126842370 isoform X2 [Adelges cooleyi]|uniref:uncharacterized protein LOC126842370 isoform X2 n=1 Tax=Adelges cooleyi TaxID=133065 RepID=UPI00217F3C96|nr:uncharacterized protein LOC126842370 isoform X2 [Adelges cooleyi]XP_050435271.1 uncharacterized protein LOC126842370 isoform X2 [Adelges cooleyi]XP_050435272.1 uncharacterized protein LOC126842370 isoform X2 [Adelges cooleyi]XP_050435273.1 uncharacterized protein LOC126842370 isoform X2 [Adelges cooleyi]XP_050435274.1 uncharacterized protein LOC126842370 isoform X2 [Adelges cooleyi]XP_050435275.1 uncharacterized protein LOC126842370 isoform X2 [Adelges cooleyi]XP_050435276.1 uncharacterize